MGTLGHTGVLKYLNKNMKNTDMKQIFDMSCKNHNLNMLKYITNIYIPDKTDKHNAVIYACTNLEMLKYITDTYKLYHFNSISDKIYRRMLCLCSSGTETIKYIRSTYKFNSVGTMDFINIMFRRMCISGDTSILKYIEDEYKINIRELMSDDAETDTSVYMTDTCTYITDTDTFKFDENDDGLMSISLSKSVAYSCMGGNLKVLEYLVRAHNITTLHSHPALLMAFGSNNPDIVKYICEKFEIKREHVLVAQKNNLSPYCAACSYMDIGTLVYLENKFNMTRDDVMLYNNRAFRRACFSGRVDILEYFNNKYHITRDEVLCARNSALVGASANGHVDVLKYLIETYDITEEVLYGFYTHFEVFVIACNNGHLDVVVYLVDTYKLQQKVVTYGYVGCFNNACINGHIEIVKYFVEKFNLPHSLDVLHKNRLQMGDGFRKLQKNGSAEMIEYLVKHGFIECSHNGMRWIFG